MKTLLTKSSQGFDLENYDSIQFVTYGLSQLAGKQVFTQQSVKQNAFLHSLVIIPVHSIDVDTIYSEIISISRKMGSIKGFEQTSKSNTRDKWFLITLKSMKPRAQTFSDDIPKYCIIPMPINNHPGRVSKTNNNTGIISYTAMSTKDSTLYDLNKNLPPKLLLKIDFTICYDIHKTIISRKLSTTIKQEDNTTRTNTRIIGRSYRYIYN